METVKGVYARTAQARDRAVTWARRLAELVRFENTRSSCDIDRVAAEKALEVRIEGRPFSVIMRTPGEDEALAAGFLFSESVIRSAADIERIDQPSPDVVNAVLSRSAGITLLGFVREGRFNSYAHHERIRFG